MHDRIKGTVYVEEVTHVIFPERKVAGTEEMANIPWLSCEKIIQTNNVIPFLEQGFT